MSRDTTGGGGPRGRKVVDWNTENRTEQQPNPRHNIILFLKEGKATTDGVPPVNVPPLQAQTLVEWEVLDVQQQQHGRSRLCQQQQPAATAQAAAVAGSSSSSSGIGQTVSTATVQRAAAAAVSAHAAVSVTVQPYISVVPCLQHCSAPVFVASSYPQELTAAVLSAVQLQDVQQQQQRVQALHGRTLQDCFQQLPANTLNGGVLVVASSPSKARPCSPSQQQQQPAALQGPVQVAEWACRAPSLRARALSGRGLGLLSEWGLAELLGADSSDAVMDGIAWRS